MPFRPAQRPRRRRGNAVLEAALVLPILTALGFGTVEFGHYFFVKHTVQGAAREGARAAIVPTGTNADVATAVSAVMTAAGYASGDYTVTVSPDSVASAAAGSNVTVTVACHWGTVGLRPLGIISTGKQVTGTTVMRREP